MRIIKTNTEYIDKQPWQTAEDMEDRCCDPLGEIVCKKTVEDWNGYTSAEVAADLGIDLDDEGRDSDGHKVKIEFLARKNPCGKTIREYTNNRKSCCDEAVPLEYVEDMSVTVMTDNSFGAVYVLGGLETLHVNIRGDGFFLDRNRSFKDGDITNNSPLLPVAIPVYTVDVCGMCEITISDGCSEAKALVAATEGVWEQVEDDLTMCGEATSIEGLYSVREGVGFRVSQFNSPLGYCSCGVCPTGSGYHCVEHPEFDHFTCPPSELWWSRESGQVNRYGVPSFFRWRC